MRRWRDNIKKAILFFNRNIISFKNFLMIDQVGDRMLLLLRIYKHWHKKWIFKLKPFRRRLRLPIKLSSILIFSWKTIKIPIIYLEQTLVNQNLSFPVFRAKLLAHLYNMGHMVHLKRKRSRKHNLMKNSRELNILKRNRKWPNLKTIINLLLNKFLIIMH